MLIKCLSTTLFFTFTCSKLQIEITGRPSSELLETFAWGSGRERAERVSLNVSSVQLQCTVVFKEISKLVHSKELGGEKHLFSSLK